MADVAAVLRALEPDPLDRLVGGADRAGDVSRERLHAQDPAARYTEISELRKAIDTLLFSGDFTPTTFNLAFFMHSLFRDDMESEARALKEEREASWSKRDRAGRGSMGWN